ncbi:MAG TPA: ATP-grasp domain-containing protein [Methylophilus sp.]
MRLAIISLSARVYTQMARREGHVVLAIDAYADQDTRRAAQQYYACPSLAHLDETTFSQLLAVLAQAQVEAVLVGSGFEHQVDYYGRLCQQFNVLGNPPEIYQTLKDPLALQRLCQQAQLLTPAVRLQPPAEGGWLQKQAGACGGAHVSWHVPGGQTRPNDGLPQYYQRWQPGVAVGGLLLGDGQQQHLLGVHWLYQRQQDFAYAGARLCQEDALQVAMQQVVESLSPHVSLLGLNSIDAVWDQQQLHVLEINPRLSASLRLYADAGLIGRHIRACKQQAEARMLPVSGHACHLVLYARQALHVTDWPWPDWLEDVPAVPVVEAGQPLCSLFAAAESEQAVNAALSEKINALKRLWGTRNVNNIEYTSH